MVESFASASTETSDLLSCSESDSRTCKDSHFPHIARSSPSGPLCVRFVPRALDSLGDHDARGHLCDQRAVSSTIIASRSISTRQEPVPPRNTIFLDCVPMTSDMWYATTKTLAAYEFNDDAAKIATVLRMMSLLVNCLTQRGRCGDRCAVLAVIADESTLRNYFSNCIQYADDGHALKFMEDTWVSASIYDDGFPRFLRDFARHETGDRDAYGRVKDGAFLISSRSGKILGAAAKLPVWATQFSIRNSGMRHETAVGIVTTMEHSCMVVLLSEGGTLKVFTTHALRAARPVYHEYAPFRNIAGPLPHRDRLSSAKSARIGSGFGDHESCGEHLAWTTERIQKWFRSQKSNGLKALLSNVPLVPRVIRRVSSRGIIMCEASRSAYTRVRESLAQLRFKEAERLIVEYTSNYAGPRSCRDDVCMTFYVLWQFRFFYKGQHDKALRFLRQCEQHVEEWPFARRQVLLLQIYCWTAKNLRNLAVHHKDNPEVQEHYFSQSFQFLQKVLGTYQLNEVDDVWAAEVHELRGRWIIDVLRTCTNGARVVLSHIAEPHYAQIVHDAEDQVQQCATFLWRAEWIDGVLQSLFATLMAQELRSHTMSELRACVHRHNELLRQWGDLPITTRTKMRFAMFSIRVRLAQLDAAVRSTAADKEWYATIDKDIAAAFTSIAHLKLAKGHKEWRELRQLKARHQRHKRAWRPYASTVQYLCMNFLWYPLSRFTTMVLRRWCTKVHEYNIPVKLS